MPGLTLPGASSGVRRAQRVGLAAAQRRLPHQPPAAGRHAAVRRRGRDRPGHRGLRRGRLGAAAATGPDRLAGGRAGRGPVLGPGPGLGQRRSRVAPPVLDRAPGHHRLRPGPDGVEQLRPRRRRLDGALRRLHAPLPPQRLHDPDRRRGRGGLADLLPRAAALLRAARAGTPGGGRSLAVG